MWLNWIYFRVALLKIRNKIDPPPEFLNSVLKGWLFVAFDAGNFRSLHYAAFILITILKSEFFLLLPFSNSLI